MHPKKRKTFVTVLVWVLVVGIAVTYVPFLFAPSTPQRRPERQDPEERQVVLPLIPKGTSTADRPATSTPTATPLFVE